jgi:hypothetical protein
VVVPVEYPPPYVAYLSKPIELMTPRFDQVESTAQHSTGRILFTEAARLGTAMGNVALCQQRSALWVSLAEVNLPPKSKNRMSKH